MITHWNRKWLKTKSIIQNLSKKTFSYFKKKANWLFIPSMRTWLTDENRDKKKWIYIYIWTDGNSSLKGAIRSLFIIITCFRYCLFLSQKKNVDRLSSLGYYYLFFSLQWNEWQKKSMYAETTEKEKENATNFFFLFALEVLNSTFFFTERKSKKKWKEQKSRVQQ